MIQINTLLSILALSFSHLGGASNAAPAVSMGPVGSLSVLVAHRDVQRPCVNRRRGGNASENCWDGDNPFRREGTTSASQTERESTRRARTLPISPRSQQTVVWCWAAVSEMALSYKGVPNLNPGSNYQCGIVGALGGICQTDCRRCVTTIGSALQLVAVLERYQDVGEYYGSRFNRVRFGQAGPLSAAEIIDEIDDGNPVMAGISPSGMGEFYPRGMSEHVTLIIGYRTASDGTRLIINDPMPYRAWGVDPYLRIGARQLRAGQYEVEYSAFRRHLDYKDSIFVR